MKIHIKLFRFIFFTLFFICFYFGCHSNIYSKENNNQTIIKVGVYDDPPLIFIDKKGEPKGIFIDIIEIISEKENLKIEYVTSEWDKLLEMLKTGEIDILPDIAATESRDSLFTFNEIPIITSWKEVYTTKRININSFSDLNNKKVGLLKNSIEHEYVKNILISNSEYNFEVLQFSDYNNAAKALEESKIDVLIGDRLFYFSDYCNKNILQTGLIFLPSNIHFGFSKKTDKELVSLFDKNISKMINDPKSDYHKSVRYWLRNYYFNFIPNYVIWITIFAVFVILMIILFLVIMKHQVNLKTKSLRLSNEALIIAKEEAQESNRLTTAFLQNIAHEIRTPMNGILGFMNLLENPDLDSETSQKYISIINQSGERLLNTINDIIEISMIESGQAKLKYSEVNIKETMTLLHDFFKPQAEKKNLNLRFDLYALKNINPVIKTDKILLDKILINLLNNAIKFTDKGYVEMGTNLKKDRLVFYLKDTGIGIPLKEFDSIFNRFVQGNNNHTHINEGCGLGLTLAKANAEILNGNITLFSEVGKGSTFSLEIPYKPVNQIE